MWTGITCETGSFKLEADSERGEDYVPVVLLLLLLLLELLLNLNLSLPVLP